MSLFIRKPDKISLQGARGVCSYDTNLRIMLVQASVKSVAQVFMSLKNMNIWESNVYGREIEIRRDSTFVFRLKGHPWSLLYVPYFSLQEIDPTKLSIQEVEEILYSPLELKINLLEADALRISELLRTCVIFYSASDTFGLTEYYIYKNGVLEERFFFQEGLLIEFQSNYRKIQAKNIKNIYKFVDESIRNKDAYIPSIDVMESFNIGKKTFLKIDGLASDQIEQMDYIGR